MYFHVLSADLSVVWANVPKPLKKGSKKGLKRVILGPNVVYGGIGPQKGLFWAVSNWVGL